QTMVEASPSALCDSTHHCAFGLPSMIQDGSIGRGVRLTTRLVVSISERDITAPRRKVRKPGLRCKTAQLGESRSQTNINLLNFAYGCRFNRSHRGAHADGA